MRARGSFVVAVLAWVAGTWVGVGAPRAMPERPAWAKLPALPALPAWTSGGVTGGTPDRPPVAGADRVAPPDPSPGAGADRDLPPAPVDARALPDPVPWPRLNVEANVGKAWLLAEGPAPAPDSGRRLVTLTFDDGPFPETTPVILRALARHDVKATFFFIGRYLEGHDDRAVATRAVAQDVVAAGHLVGNHTRDHQLLTTIAHAQALEQIDDGARDIERAIGVRPVLFRPPYGQLDPFTEDALRARGAELVLWTVEASDMKNDDPEAIAASLERQIEQSYGGIVLLHDVRWSTVKALPKLLDWLHARRFDPARPRRVGYDVVDLVTYLRETAARPQPYPDRPSLEHARGAAHRAITHPST